MYVTKGGSARPSERASARARFAGIFVQWSHLTSEKNAVFMMPRSPVDLFDDLLDLLDLLAQRPSRGPARGFRPSFFPSRGDGISRFPLGESPRVALPRVAGAPTSRGAGRTSPRARGDPSVVRHGRLRRCAVRSPLPFPPTRFLIPPDPRVRRDETDARGPGRRASEVPRAAPGAVDDASSSPSRINQSSSDSETRGAGRRRRRLILPVARPLDRRRASRSPLRGRP